MFGAGIVFDELQDRLHDMGCPPARFGRVTGKHKVWLSATLPKGTVDYQGETLDTAARAILDCELTAPDQARTEAKAGLS